MAFVASTHTTCPGFFRKSTNPSKRYSSLCLSNAFKNQHQQKQQQHSFVSREQFNTFSLSTVPRKLLCKPPQQEQELDENYVGQDYLVKKISAKEVEELVKGGRNVPLVIDFYATWCGPCIIMAQELEMLAVEYESNALIVKVDTDDEYEFARGMQVRGLPTLFFISPDPSKDAVRTEGLIPIQMMRDIINNEM